MIRAPHKGVLLVGPIPRTQSYVGGIAMLLIAQLTHWELPFPVAHFNTQLWARNFGATGKFRLSHVFAFFINAVRLAWRLVRLRPAIVHFHSSIRLALLKDMMLAFMVRRLTGSKVVFQIHFAVADQILISRSPIFRRCQLWFLMQCADRVAFLSHGVFADLAAMLPPKAKAALAAKACILPNFTKIPSAVGKRPEASAPVCLFFIGNVGFRKGAYDLICASHKMVNQGLKNFRMVFAGPFDSPADEARLKGLVKEHALQAVVTFLGPLTGEAKEQAFRNADIFTLPSYGEGVPISLLEAMAYGLPAVVTDVGGIPETITDGLEGLLLRPGNIDALAEALVRLVEAPAFRLQMGQAARTRAIECNSITRFYKELRGLYSSLQCMPLPDHEPNGWRAPV